jgi:hypothetical protein
MKSAEEPTSKPTKTCTSRRPGFHSKFVHIPDSSWAKITEFIDLNCLDEDKWLTQQLSKLADSLETTPELPFDKG